MAGKSQSSGKKSSSKTDHASQVTIDHDEIRKWAEERGGKPACVKGTGGKGDTGLLRIDFPGYSGGDSLQEITWDEFFEKFEDQQLAMVFQEQTSKGEQSNFNKLINRDIEGGGKSASRHGRDSK